MNSSLKLSSQQVYENVEMLLLFQVLF